MARRKLSQGVGVAKAKWLRSTVAFVIAAVGRAGEAALAAEHPG